MHTFPRSLLLLLPVLTLAWPGAAIGHASAPVDSAVQEGAEEEAPAGQEDAQADDGTKYAMIGLPRELVRFVRVPGGGRHPQSMVDDNGVLHVVFFRRTGGEPNRNETGDVLYVTSTDDGKTFTQAERLNAIDGAVGLTRGALGLSIFVAGGTVHVLMSGSEAAQPRGPEGENPLLYTRRVAGADGFEPVKNLVSSAWDRGAGVAVTAAGEGNVHAFLSAANPSGEGQSIFHARSQDDGASFAGELAITPDDREVSMESGLSAAIGPKGRIVGSYRSLIGKRRDSTLFLSENRGESFEVKTTAFTARRKDPASGTRVNLGATGQYLLVSWEEGGEVVWSYLTPRKDSVAYPMMPKVRPKRYQRSPMAVTNHSIACTLTWMEKVKGEADETFVVAWQAWDITGRRPIGRGISPDACEGSTPSIFVRSDDGFGILY